MVGMHTSISSACRNVCRQVLALVIVLYKPYLLYCAEATLRYISALRYVFPRYGTSPTLRYVSHATVRLHKEAALWTKLEVGHRWRS